MNHNYDILKLDHQLCFPLYAASREVTRLYHPFLSKLDLTYTQYVTMLVLWENSPLNVKDLSQRLHLDSGTLTPLLKGLEKKGYITRTRSSDDERFLIVALTPEGLALRDEALSIPEKVTQCISLSEDEAKTLYTLLYKVLETTND